MVKHVKDIVEGNCTRSHTWDCLNCPCKWCIRGRATSKALLEISPFGGDVPNATCGRQSSKTDETPKRITICGYCKQEIGRGKPHNCTRSSRFDNIRDMCSPGTLQMVASSVVSQEFQKAKEAGKSKIAVLKSKYGPALTIKAKDVKDEGFIITKDNMDQLRSILSLSKRKTYEAGRYLKEITGSKMEKGMKSYIFNSETCLAEFFEVVEINFADEDQNFDDSIPVSSGKKNLQAVKRHVCRCTDVEGLVVFLMNERYLEGLDLDDIIIKIGKFYFFYFVYLL